MVSEMLGSQTEDIILLLEARDASVFSPPGRGGALPMPRGSKTRRWSRRDLQLSAWIASILSS